MKPQQPQFNIQEPRRTQRLEPPPREVTPDPFEPADPFSPESSPDLRPSKAQRRLDESEPPLPSMLLAQSPDQSRVHDSHMQDSDDEGESSQLFPGSDLF